MSEATNRAVIVVHRAVRVLLLVVVLPPEPPPAPVRAGLAPESLTEVAASVPFLLVAPWTTLRLH